MILFFAGLILGLAAGYLARKEMALRQAQSAEAKVSKLLDDAKAKQREILLEGKNRALKIIEDAKKEEQEAKLELKNIQKRVEKREALFDQKLLEFEEKQQKLVEKAKRVEDIKTEILKIKDEQMIKLEKISALTKDEAKKILLENTENQVKEELFSRVRKLEQQTTEELEAKAKELLSMVIERCASSHSAETTTTTVNLPNDEMKGRIIGKEGRNIKTLEQLAGVEIVVDETPGTIWISGFSPIRRQLAKITLDKLINDGRIHPGRIEESYELARKELAQDIKKAGEEATYEVGVVGLDPKLVQILGRLKYRTSYGHNVLRHSVEVALLSGMLAEELDADVSIAKKGGLLHDIGKAVDYEVKGSHTEIGQDIMKKFGLPEEVAYISVGHHEDHPKSLEGIIVKVADAISGARPGARKDTYEQYVQRLEELENLAKSFTGVEKTYAIQAGREVRVFVKPQEVDDWNAQKLARDIANRIEEELKYPGEIKVTLIRETRIIEYAR